LINQEQPHLVAICEVKPKNGSLRPIQDYSINGYSINYTNIDKNQGRGIIIFSHHSISHLVLQITSPIKFEEACIIEVRLSGNDTLIFACLYRSPTLNCMSIENNTNLNSLLKSLALNKKYSHTCFVGDFNFKSINWSSWTTPYNEESKEERFLEAVRDSYLHQHVQEPTRCRGADDPSTIDLILTGEENQLTNLDYHSPLGKSDHSILSFTYNCYSDCKTPTKRFMYTSGDFTAMRDWFVENNWVTQFVQTAQNKSVNVIWNEFKNTLLSLRDRFVPLKEIGKPSWKNKGDIPINKDLRQLIKEKKRLHRKWINSHSQPNGAKCRTEYNKVRNKVKLRMTQAKREFERNICYRSNENPKIFWSHVRSCLKTKSGVSPLLDSVTDKESLKFDDYDKANILQRQFCGVFTQEPEGDLPYFEEKTNKIMEDFHITTDMVKKGIQSLDPTKAFGPDEIHPKILKELVGYVSEPLAIVMNKTLENGSLPDDWKMAHVTPIYKKGARNIAANYRPVSLTSIICKLMETIVKSHIVSHLVEENLLSPKQYGFVSKRSTTTQLLSYLDKCSEIIATGKVVDSIYFDFAKAFDTVPHRRLLRKLDCYGIKGKVLQWIKEFLKDRRQLVKLNGVESIISPVISGIPQGSVLGPLLFVIYINDLPDEVLSDIYLFADDTKILKQVDSREDSLILQKDINSLERWSREWLLKFHPDKCHVLTLGKFGNIKHAHPYALGERELEHVFIEKDLGVVFDSELTFEEHISEKVTKANTIAGLIRRSFSYLSPRLFRQLFTAFVRPHLEYAQAVWSPKLRKYVNLIEKVQKRATRFIDGFKDLAYEERLRRLDLPTLEYRRTLCDMIEVYKHINFYDRRTIPDKLVLRTRPNRKHNLQILPNFANDGVRGIQSRSFYYRCVSTWNDLPRTVVNSPNVNIFKKRIDNAWKNHPLRYGN